MDLKEHLKADSEGPRGKRKTIQQLYDFRKGGRFIEESTQDCTVERGRQFNIVHLKIELNSTAGGGY